MQMSISIIPSMLGVKMLVFTQISGFLNQVIFHYTLKIVLQNSVFIVNVLYNYFYDFLYGISSGRCSK